MFDYLNSSILQVGYNNLYASDHAFQSNISLKHEYVMNLQKKLIVYQTIRKVSNALQLIYMGTLLWMKKENWIRWNEKFKKKYI